MNGLEAIGLFAFGTIAFGAVVVVADFWFSKPHPPAGGDDAASQVGGEGEFLSLEGVHLANLGSGDADFVGNRSRGLP